MLTTIIVLISIIIIYFIKTKFLDDQVEPFNNTKRPINEDLPYEEIENDKLVIFENISSAEIDKVLIEVCNMYNNEKYIVLTRLYKITNNSFVVTFPFDIDFEIFCYFINYVAYPMGFDKTFDASGWTTMPIRRTMMSDYYDNKNVMLYIPSTDTEHDNVYLTTEDNIGFIYRFGDEKKFLSSPDKFYVKPKYQLNDLVNLEYKNYS